MIITNNNTYQIIEPEIHSNNDITVMDILGCAVGINPKEYNILKHGLKAELNECIKTLDAYVNSISNLPLANQKQAMREKMVDAYSLLNTHILGMNSSEYKSMCKHCHSLGLDGWKSFDIIFMFAHGIDIRNGKALITDEQFDGKFADPFIQYFRKCAQIMLDIV